jgi:hypothetical protein
MAMARDWILLMMACMGCTEPLNPKVPPTTRMDGGAQSAKDAGADGATTDKQAQGAKAKGAAEAGADDDDDMMAADAGTEPADVPPMPDAGAMPDAAQDGAAGAAAPQAVVGTWAGQLQDLLNRPINACVVVTQVGTQGDAGHTSYTGTFTCRCRLSYRETVGDVHSFDEIVTSGMGCPTVGLLELEVKSDGTLKYDWYLNVGSLPEGIGTLNRVDSCE